VALWRRIWRSGGTPESSRVLLAAPIWLRLAFYPFALQAAYFTLGPAMMSLGWHGSAFQ